MDRKARQARGAIKGRPGSAARMCRTNSTHPVIRARVHKGFGTRRRAEVNGFSTPRSAQNRGVRGEDLLRRGCQPRVCLFADQVTFKLRERPKIGNTSLRPGVVVSMDSVETMEVSCRADPDLWEPRVGNYPGRPGQSPVAVRAGLSCRYFHVALCIGARLGQLDLNVVAQADNEAQQPIGRESIQTAAKELGDFGLPDAEELGGLGLGKAAALDNAQDFGGKLGLGHILVGILNAEVGKDVAVDFAPVFTRHLGDRAGPLSWPPTGARVKRVRPLENLLLTQWRRVLAVSDPTMGGE